MKEIWFTSDQHFYDDKAIEAWHRPFASTTQMNEALVEYHNAVVKPDHDVYMIGDFAICRSVDAVDLLLRRLNGYLHLVPGAHDFPVVTRGRFRSVETAGQMLIRFRDHTFVLNHHPMYSWAYKNQESWQLHGHCHGKRHENGFHRRVDVGVDAWDYKPINVEDLIAYWKAQRQSEDIGHEHSFVQEEDE